MQILCGLQVVFFLFNCQTPGTDSPSARVFCVAGGHRGRIYGGHDDYEESVYSQIWRMAVSRKATGKIFKI